MVSTWKCVISKNVFISKCQFSQPGDIGVDVTQKRKVVLIGKLPQICRKTYSIESWSFTKKKWFQIWITWLSDYLLPWQPLKSSLMILCGMSICMYPLNMSITALMSCWVRMTPVFSQSEALYGNYGNQMKMKIRHWFWKSVTRATILIFNTYL